MNARVPLPRTGRVLPDLTLPRATPVAPASYFGRAEPKRVRELFEAGHADGAIAAALGVSLATIRLRRRALGLKRRHGKRMKEILAAPAAALRSTSRHAPRAVVEDRLGARMLAVAHPAVAEARTLFPGSVVPVHGLKNALVTGDNSWKIGSVVTKKRWRGFPIYTLTLEERATCPTGCAHWRSCYGNGMPWAKRIAPGPDLEERLACELGVLAQRYPAGFAVRLHVLGDFYSVGYVDRWRAWVERYPNLHVFGFSARHALGDDVGTALIGVIVDHWPRFAIRLSNFGMKVGSTVTIEHPLQKPADAIVCPQQLGRTANCGTCALCWSTDQRIAFLRH